MCADTPLCGETAHEWDLAALVLRGRPPAVDAADPARACWALDASAHHTLALAAEPHARRLVLRVRRTGPPAREQRATVGLGAVAALARHAGGVLRVALRRDTARSPDVWALTAGALDTCDEIRACLAARADAAPAAALLARVCGLPPCPHIVSGLSLLLFTTRTCDEGGKGGGGSKNTSTPAIPRLDIFSTI